MDVKVHKPLDQYLEELSRLIESGDMGLVPIADAGAARGLGRLGRETNLFSVAKERGGDTFLFPKQRFFIEGKTEFIKHTWFRIRV